MEVKIEWSELAEKQLKDIFDYFSMRANSRVATKIIDKITERVDVLYHNPFSGQKEELLAEYPDDYRYLVEGYYKIIYWVGSNIITVASVFDCRQNPEKMKNL
jgi:addiction module RelE/StbE family toxin